MRPATSTYPRALEPRTALVGRCAGLPGRGRRRAHPTRRRRDRAEAGHALPGGGARHSRRDGAGLLRAVRRRVRADEEVVAVPPGDLAGAGLGHAWVVAVARCPERVRAAQREVGLARGEVAVEGHEAKLRAALGLGAPRLRDVRAGGGNRGRARVRRGARARGTAPAGGKQEKENTGEASVLAHGAGR